MLKIFRNIVLVVVSFGAYLTIAKAQKIDYKQEAAKLYHAIQENFYIKDSGYYRELALGQKAEKPVSYLWPLCAMVQAGNEMDVLFSSNHYMDDIITVIEKYRDSRPPTVGFSSYKLNGELGDRFYDDNQWIGIAALDAYKRTKQTKYLNLGREMYQFMMSGYDTVSGGGLYWVEPNREGKNTCSNGPGILVALGMFDATNQKTYLDTAKQLYAWTKTHLLSPEGLYFDNYNVKTHKVDSTFFSYNAGTMLESAVWLYQLTKDKRYLTDAKNLASKSCEYFLKDGCFRDDYWFNAVLLRGFIRYQKIAPRSSCIQIFRTALDDVIRNKKDETGLYKKETIVNLVGQGGMLEMLCRFAMLK